MDYGERFNYGKIKDDFGYPDHNGYYSSTHTSFDSKFNQIPSLDNLQEQYPDKYGDETFLREKVDGAIS